MVSVITAAALYVVWVTDTVFKYDIFPSHSSAKVRRHIMNKIFKFRFLGIMAFLAMIAIFSVAALFLPELCADKK